MYINFTSNICVYERTFLTTNKVTNIKMRKQNDFTKTQSTPNRRYPDARHGVCDIFV